MKGSTNEKEHQHQIHPQGSRPQDVPQYLRFCGKGEEAVKDGTVVLETDPDNCPEFDSWRKAGMTPIRNMGPVMTFGIELVDEIHKGMVDSYDRIGEAKPLLDPVFIKKMGDQFLQTSERIFYGRKPTFKNIRELTEQEVESLKVKSR